MEFIRKKHNESLQIVHHYLPEGEDLPLLTFPALNSCGCVRHGFSTRAGGVSEGYFSTLNLKFDNGDDNACVCENYRRLAEAFGVSPDNFVFTDQTHTNHVRTVTREDAGKGLTRPKDYTDVDGLITNEPGLVLSAFFADCVPLFFVDPVHRAIGLAHSGWKGTVRRIGAAVVSAMAEQFGTAPSDLVCAIGPSICRDCYEIGLEVAEEFMAEFPGYEERILTKKKNGKYLLDLWETCQIVLMEAGVNKDRIHVTDICTCCNPELLFSHRATGGKRGNLAAFLMLSE